MTRRPDTSRGNPAVRLAAVVALVAVTIAVSIVIAGSLGDDSGDGRAGSRPATGEPAPSGDRYYVVKPGDTLSEIGFDTGVPVEELQSLNPDLDPQNLLSGQRVRLR